MNPYYYIIVVMAAVGLYIIMTKKNIMRVLMGLSLMESAVNLFIITVGYNKGGTAPIYSDGVTSGFVDPIPQALVLTAIVIGVSVLALALTLTVKHYQTTGATSLEYKGGAKE